MRVYVLSRLSCVCLSVTPRTVTHQASLSMGFSRQEQWGGLPCPLQGIFPTLGVNLHLLPWHWVSLPLCHLGSLIPSMMVAKSWFSISIIPAAFTNWCCTVRRSFPFFFPSLLSSLRFHGFSFYSMDCKPHYYFKVHIFQVWVMELPSSWLLSYFDMSSLNFEHCLTLFKGQICFFPPPSFIEK